MGLNKFGLAIDVSAPDTIIHSLHDEPSADPFPAAPGLLQVVSSSTEDKSGGSGASAVRAWGLTGSPGSTVPFNEAITLDGDTPVNSLADGFRVFRAHVIEGATNVGDVDFLIGGVPVVRIAAATGQTETATMSLGDDQAAELDCISASLIKITGGGGGVAEGIIKTWVKRFEGPWHTSVTPLVVRSTIGIQTYAFPGVGPTVRGGYDMKMAVSEIDGAGDIVAGFCATIFR